MKIYYLFILFFCCSSFFSCNDDDFILLEHNDSNYSFVEWFNQLERDPNTNFLSKKNIDWDWDNLSQTDLEDGLKLYVLKSTELDISKSYRLVVLSMDREYDGILYEYNETTSKKSTKLNFYGKEIVYDMSGSIIASNNLNGSSLLSSNDGFGDMDAYLEMARIMDEGDGNGWVWDAESNAWVMQEYVVNFENTSLNNNNAAVNWTSVLNYINTTYSPYDYYYVPYSITGGNPVPPTSSTNSNVVINLPYGKAPLDIEEFLKCFSGSQAADLWVFVKQPVANSNQPFDAFGSDRKAGHAWIGINQGWNVTKAFGFYPEDGANPGDPVDNGIFVDNGGDSYDVAIKIPISSSKLNSVLANIESYNEDYNLNENNCTDFVIQVAKWAGFTLPDPYSSWGGGLGGGSNPGAFGEALRTYSLYPGMIRNENGGYSFDNQGSCN